VLLRLLTPLIPHTTSEAYSYLPHRDEVDVYLLSMPAALYENAELEANYDQFMSVRESVLKALEEARAEKIIGKSFNAKLVLYPKGKTIDLFRKINVNLQQIFIVSQLEIKSQGYGTFVGDDLSIDVLAAEGVTCARCWQVVDHLDEDGLCERCQAILHE